ncbi:TVP38/TMEM64 family protein [Streptococcus gallolyticus]|uniref:TVP38/TMEM64 family protein n=1 Tax=Streptococcus gallolyticus TaxID=315405 RepID=A0A368UBL8_9STRE|nr:VTT domain-containing protein [Streptococcus gallolyticus]RCW16374.1 TVP38/TMEM64 family protein [Streptococcus gallolyticus]
MKKNKYRYDDLRKLLIIVGIIVVVSYFVIYMIGHWTLVVSFLKSSSQADMKAILAQLRSRTILNFVILIVLTAVTAAIPFMSNAIFAIFNGVVYGPGIGLLMNIVGNILGNFVFIKVLKTIDITDSEKKLKNRFIGIDWFKKTDFGIILGYMIPIVPTILVNYHVAESKLAWRKWLCYITIGVAPSSCIYALGGDAIVAGNLRRILVLLVIIVFAYLLVTYLKRRGKKKA